MFLACCHMAGTLHSSVHNSEWVLQAHVGLSALQRMRAAWEGPAACSPLAWDLGTSVGLGGTHQDP